MGTNGCTKVYQYYDKTAAMSAGTQVYLISVLQGSFDATNRADTSIAGLNQDSKIRVYLSGGYQGIKPDQVDVYFLGIP